MRILAQGDKTSLFALVVPSTKSSPAWDYMKGLAGGDQGAFQSRFEHLVTQGYLRSPEYMRDLKIAGQPTVFEIKVDRGPGLRLYVIQRAMKAGGFVWIATHGRSKPKDSQISSEVTRARNLYEEWQS